MGGCFDCNSSGEPNDKNVMKKEGSTESGEGGFVFQITRPTRMTRLGSKIGASLRKSRGEKVAKKSIVPMEPTIEESELSHSNTKKSEISIGNERKVSKLSFGGDDVRFYEKDQIEKRGSKISFNRVEEVQEYEKETAIKDDENLIGRKSFTIIPDKLRNSADKSPSAISNLIAKISQTFSTK